MAILTPDTNIKNIDGVICLNEFETSSLEAPTPPTNKVYFYAIDKNNKTILKYKNSSGIEFDVEGNVDITALAVSNNRRRQVDALAVADASLSDVESCSRKLKQLNPKLVLLASPATVVKDTNDKVNKWIDLSGNNHDFTAPTSANEPTLVRTSNGSIALSFDGIANYLSSSYISTAVDMTIMAVFTAGPYTTRRSLFAGDLYQYELEVASTAGIKWTRRRFNESGWTETTFGDYPAVDEIVLTHVSNAGNQMQVGYEADLINAGSTAGSFGYNAGNTTFIGNRSGRYWLGDILAIIQFERQLNDNERKEAVRLLSHFTGIYESKYQAFQLGAHRGDSTQPENTLASIQTALDSGAEWIEIDVTKTLDGILYLMHDTGSAGLDRTTNGTGDPTKVTWEYVSNLNSSGEPIPSLQEVFELTRGRARIIIDDKGGWNNDEFEKIVSTTKFPRQDIYHLQWWGDPEIESSWSKQIIRMDYAANITPSGLSSDYIGVMRFSADVTDTWVTDVEEANLIPWIASSNSARDLQSEANRGYKVHQLTDYISKYGRNLV